LQFLWERCAAGARILRVFSDTPCPSLPASLGGVPVTEIGPYCFAERAVTAGEAWPPESDLRDTHAVTGNFLEEVRLPETVRVLHSAAFYNCRRLRRITLGASIEALGSDLFTNCRALAEFALLAAPADPTGLKKLLGAVSADISAVFLRGDGARLLYPEYYEFLDENAPAHLFNRAIEGEGYRLRQCFLADGAVDFAAYDAAFARLTVGETPQKLALLALGRLLSPHGLAAGEPYTAYLRDHPDAAFTLALERRDADAVRFLVALGLPTAQAAARCAALGWSEGAALLLQGNRPKKRYDF